MTEAQQTTHEERHRALVERLAANLQPVRRLWPVRVRLGLWLALQAVLLVWVASHTPNDFMRKLEAPRYLLEVAMFAGAAILAAVIALRSAIPGRPVRTGELAITLVLLLAGTGLLITQPLRTGYPLSEFIGVGRLCAMHTCLLAALPWIALWWAVKRGAPMHAGAAGLAVGTAAALLSFALMRLKCPNDERLHLLTWHLLPALLIAALSALAGMLWLRFRPRPPGPG
ncbi:MAG: NrsF family protein [Candidatus Binataceae bacterium]